MRLIYAEEVERLFNEQVENGATDLFDAFDDALQDAPTVDAVPVVHGRWDDIPNTYMSVASKDCAYHGNATSCSVCHEVNPNAYKTNYCPNCGAKMDLEEEHG